MTGKILGAFCAVAVLIAVFGYFMRSNNLSNSELVKKMAITANSNSPRMINEVIRIEGATAVGNELITQYTFLNFGEGEADPDALLNLVKPGAISQGCSNMEYFEALKKGVIFTYIYNDNVGNVINKLSIDKDSCQ